MQKNKIIVLSGYPKSGTTWATRVIGHLVDCPIKGYWGFNADTFVTEGKDRNSSFICYKSHMTYTELKNSDWGEIDKIIYIIRDPRDVIVSGAYHYNLLPNNFHFLKRFLLRIPFIGKFIFNFLTKIITHETKLELMANCVLNGDKRYIGCKSSWKNHVNSFLPKNAHIIKYEDLLQDGFNTSVGILNYLNIPVNSNHINEVIEAQKFENKKKEFKKSKELIKYTHLRKGVTEEWKKELTDEFIVKIESKLKNLLAHFKYPIS